MRDSLYLHFVMADSLSKSDRRSWYRFRKWA